MAVRRNMNQIKTKTGKPADAASVKNALSEEKARERVSLAAGVFDELYPDAACSLEYDKPYELLIAARLSAQCTDARVNIVCQDLFQKYPTLESFAQAEISEVEEVVRPCGLGKTKAKSIVEMSRQMMENFDGQVPDTMEDLLSLSGVGRKIANLMLGDVFGKPAVVTDTHCIRITGRLGLTANTSPAKVEKDLLKVIPPEISSRFCHQLVQFGRDWCTARSPKCTDCPLAAAHLSQLGEPLRCSLEKQEKETAQTI